MENKITFGKWEAVALLINSICARIFLNFPRQIIEDSGTAAWIETLYFSLIVLLAFFVIEKLYTRFEGKDLIDIAEYGAGSIGRVIIGLVVTSLLLYIGPVFLREYAENMKVIALNVSPISFVMLFFLVGIIIAAYMGIEAIVRFHAMAVPIITVTFFIIIFGVAPYFNIDNFFPLLGNGVYSIVAKGAVNVSIYAPMVYLFLIPPFIKTHKNFKNVGYLTIGLSVFFFLVSCAAYLAVNPYETAIENFLPMYQMARLINYGRFFQRVESIFMLAWAATALMYLSVILYFICYIFKKTFKLQYHEPLIIPFAIIMFSLSFLPPNLMSAIELETKFYRSFAWIAAFALPILLLLIVRLLKRHPKTKEEGAETENE